jgi:hypothetical protein
MSQWLAIRGQVCRLTPGNAYRLQRGLQVLELDGGLLREQCAAQGRAEGQAQAAQKHLYISSDSLRMSTYATTDSETGNYTKRVQNYKPGRRGNYISGQALINTTYCTTAVECSNAHVAVALPLRVP